ncbi:MAG TPA: type II secretion system protein [Acidimicrobiales bacterium]|nr:type II secretion system protein [Acidimicrobiales bacterium]
MDTSKSSELLRRAREILAKRAAMAEEEGAESGFTLIELMVVLLIMAILLAIAIPTFLGVKGGAQDRAAQSNLTNALMSAKAIYATNSSYLTGAGTMASSLNAAEPALSFVTGSVAGLGGNQISVNVPITGQIILVASSPNNGGTCWAVSDWDGSNASNVVGGLSNAGTWYAEWKVGASGCSAATAALPTGMTGANWSQKYPTAAPSLTGN